MIYQEQRLKVLVVTHLLTLARKASGPHTDQSNLMVWGIDGWKGLPQEGTNLAVKIGISEIVKRKIYIR